MSAVAALLGLIAYLLWRIDGHLERLTEFRRSHSEPPA